MEVYRILLTLKIVHAGKGNAGCGAQNFQLTHVYVRGKMDPWWTYCTMY